MGDIMAALGGEKSERVKAFGGEMSERVTRLLERMAAADVEENLVLCPSQCVPCRCPMRFMV